MQPALLKQYSGKWVLFEDGRVLDADEDYQGLLQRIKDKKTYRVVFVRKVLQPESNF